MADQRLLRHRLFRAFTLAFFNIADHSEMAINAYEATLLVISHDAFFLEQVRVSEVIKLI